MTQPSPEPVRLMLLYWGRRGSNRFLRELVEVAVTDPAVTALLSVSRNNEEFSGLAESGAELLPVDTFSSARGAVTSAWRVPLLQRTVRRTLRRTGTTLVLDLMPHVWSSFIVPAVRHSGARYACVVHDARRHPGDRTSLVAPLIHRAARRADRVLVLSEVVAADLEAKQGIARSRLTVLFHPDLHFPAPSTPDAGAVAHAPLRLLFLGRVLPYKGLGLFLDTVHSLRAAGVDVAPGVFGEGNLGEHAPRLLAMGAEVVNRWLSDVEIGAALARYDVLVASHVEASQSGAVAAALGAGVPPVVTPVGGLAEQVTDGVTGIVATAPDAASLTAAVQRLVQTPGLYAQIRRTIAEGAPERSMERFLRACIVAAGQP